MTIGETLAKARRDAGLTVVQVSERTRIREPIIRGIERDDYSGCGGDFYARGDIRSIARTVGADPAPLIAEYDATVRAPEEITAAEALQPAMPIRAVGRRRPNWTLILALALLAVIGFLGYLLAASPRHAPAAPTGFSLAHHHRPSVTPRARRTPAPTPRPTPSPTPTAVSVTPVSAAAFGPGGAATGDNSLQAPLAIDGSPATAWNTNWYTTPEFGGLQAGTGLLLDLGKPTTIIDAQVTLGSTAGAAVELRAGSTPALADLRTVADASNAGGVLQLRPTGPVRGRYLLVWFTRLPPDASGTYQAFVYAVSLKAQG